MSKQTTLKLNLTFEWYDLMAQGVHIKKEEIRKPTNWIKSRLFNKDGSKREYDKIRFYRGYTSTCFETDFEYFIEESYTHTRYYGSQEKEVLISAGDFIIKYSKIIE